MSGPYINTELYTNVTLNPNQMDNKIYINLKRNLEENVAKKCFRDYGYIMEVYEILNFKDGVIQPENLMGSSIFDVTFSCRLCMPLKNKQIICQVIRVNKLLITVGNGPILVIITNNRINDKVFFTDVNNNLRYRIGEKSQILKSKEFVKITVISTTFNHGDNKIKVIGFLEDIADDQEKTQFYSQLYNKDEKLINYEDYIKENGAEEDVNLV